MNNSDEECLRKYFEYKALATEAFEKQNKKQNKKQNEEQYIRIPVKPSNELLNSMAIRYDHAFGLSLPDEEIERMRKEYPISGSQYKTKREKEQILITMKQLHEEVVGQGFYRYE